VIKEEMAMYLDDPQHHVQELLNASSGPTSRWAGPSPARRRRSTR